MSERFEDDELLEALAASIDAAQPMPASAVELARAAWDARALDAEFAALVADSLSPDEERLAVRAQSGPRMLSFSAGDVALELEVEPIGTGVHRVAGQLLPPGAARVTLERGGEAQHAEADATGRFAFERVGEGAVRLRVEDARDRAVVSAWFRV